MGTPSSYVHILVNQTATIKKRNMFAQLTWGFAGMPYLEIFKYWYNEIMTIPCAI